MFPRKADIGMVIAAVQKSFARTGHWITLSNLLKYLIGSQIALRGVTARITAVEKIMG
jgi:hypothetical protein